MGQARHAVIVESLDLPITDTTDPSPTSTHQQRIARESKACCFGVQNLGFSHLALSMHTTHFRWLKDISGANFVMDAIVTQK